MDNVKLKENSVNTSKKIVGVQMPTFLYDKLKEEADKKFVSVSDIVRGLLYNWLETNNHNK